MDKAPYAILDVRGLMLYSLLGGKDPDGKLTEDGKVENTAIYGFSRFLDIFLLPLLDVCDPRKVVAVHDGGNSYRRNLFPGYKLKRSQRVVSDFMKDEIQEMEYLVDDLLKAIGCTQVKVARVEADDVVAHLCEKLPNEKFVYTVDQDLLQLDNETTHVMYQGAMAKENPDLPNPKHVRITKSLLGDTSDEYPGVTGFGEKKFEKLIEEFGDDVLDDLEACVANKSYKDISDAYEVAVDTQAKKGLDLLLKNTGEWELMYHLAGLHPELCEEQRQRAFPELKWTKRVPNYHTLEQALKNGMREDLLHRLSAYTPKYELVTNANWDSFVDRFMEEVDRTPFFAFDYESVDVLKHPDFNEAKRGKGSYVDVLSQSITGMSICYGQHLENVAYISVGHRDTDNVHDEYLKDVLETVREHGKELVAHNAPFEHALTDTNFLYDPGNLLDSRLMAQYVDENESNHLKDLSKRHLGYLQTTYADTLEQAGAKDMQEMTGLQVLNYGCDDSLVTACLTDLFYMILQLEGTWDFCTTEETAANSVLYEAFEGGMRIDYDRLQALAEEDNIAYEENMLALRNTLLVHCNTADPKRAAELYNEVSEYEEAKMRDDGKDQVAIDKKLAALRERLEAGTRYEPFIEEQEEVKFTPTALKITKLVQSEFDCPIELTGVTPNKVTEFLVAVEDNKTTVFSEAEDEFFGALAACSEQLKKREGKEFEEFLALCKNIVGRGQPAKMTGDALNVDSPIQMQTLLYCKLGLPIRLHGKLQRGSTRERLGYREGGPSADDKAIDTALAEDCQTDDALWKKDALLALKTAKAAYTRYKNYWRPYPLWKHPRDGNVHGSIANCGTVTKRFTGSNPNFLQLTGKDGGRVRSIVLPFKEDHVILSPDFNGEELRITASLSLDPVMVDAYVGRNQRDLHSMTAAGITGAALHFAAPDLLKSLSDEFTMEEGLLKMPYEKFLGHLGSEDKRVAEVFKNIRKLAKGVNFLLLYVGGAGTLARNLGVPTDIAEQFLNAAMATYPRLGPWQQESIEFAREHGYVLTAYGNRRHLGNGLFSEDNGIRTRLERQAVNSQVQGTGSDIMKVVMKKIQERKLLQTVKGHLLVAPYDELAISVPRSAAWHCWMELQDIMTLTPPGHVVPQLPELKASALNWGSVIEMGPYPSKDEIYAMLDEQLAKRQAA